MRPCPPRVYKPPSSPPTSTHFLSLNFSLLLPPSVFYSRISPLYPSPHPLLNFASPVTPSPPQIPNRRFSHNRYFQGLELLLPRSFYLFNYNYRLPLPHPFFVHSFSPLSRESSPVSSCNSTSSPPTRSCPTILRRGQPTSPPVPSPLFRVKHRDIADLQYLLCWTNGKNASPGDLRLSVGGLGLSTRGVYQLVPSQGSSSAVHGP